MQSLTSLIKILVSTCFLLFLRITTTKAQGRLPPYPPVCVGSSNYTQGSTYASNLNTTLTSLASEINSTGFYTTGTGTNRDRVYGLLQCRNDISFQDCQSCARNLSSETVNRCPFRREALIFWDFCYLRYADYNFYSEASITPLLSFNNSNVVSDPAAFHTQLRGLMGNISARAASDPLKFATGKDGDISGLVQCVRTISDDGCSKCLQAMIGNISSCCEGKQGGQVLSSSCWIRYEQYSFFTSSSPPSGTPQPPPPPPDVNSPPTNTNGLKRKNNSRTITLTTTITAVLLLAVSIYLFRGKLRNRVGKTIFLLWRKLTKSVGVETRSAESLIIDLSTLKIATNNFSESNELGQGGFGKVYKGKLPDGPDIAVKRLSKDSGQGTEELKTEVVLVAKLLHRNLVTLLGFCLEEEEKLLVYEYLPNGSLDKILFDRNKSGRLGWDKRYKIITGIARGLLYLHEDSQLRIIHRDMKPSNILLDENMNAKISDFGLAKLFVGSQVQGNTNKPAGTRGYMAPEYTMYGQFSPKSDVFSFGVLTLEIIAGRKNWSHQGSMNLSSYAWQVWSEGRPLDMVDPALGNRWSSNQVIKCIQIGLLCVQPVPSHRPTMSEVLLLLNTDSVACRVPSRPPAYYVGNGRTEEDSSTANEFEKFSMQSSQPTANEVTITELYPR